MMKSPSPILFVALIAAFMSAMPAGAQIRDSQLVPAVVQLEQAPDPPLAMTLVRPLDFGKVTIPNRFFRANAVCEYRATANQGLTGSVEMFEGSLLLAGSQTSPSGCHVVTPGNVGVIAITCEARRTIFFNFSTVRNSAAPTGIVFGTDVSARLANQDGSQAEFFSASGGKPCFPAGATPSSPIVTRHLSVGGRITVQAGQELPTNRTIEVGSVRVEAFYP